MQTPQKAFGRDLHGAAIGGPVRSLARAMAEGIWNMRNDAPTRCVDADRFGWHVGRMGLALPSRLARGIVTAKEAAAYAAVAGYLRQFTSDAGAAARDFLAALDAMLFSGGQRWAADWHNLVVNAGLDHLLDVTLSGGTQDTSWFVGLLAASPTPAATWTATEIAAADFVDYDEATLQAFTDGGVSGQSLDNSGSVAAFTVSTNSSSIGGAYLIGTNAKATPAGTLYSAGAFTGGNKAADDGDTLSVTSTFTMAAA